MIRLCKFYYRMCRPLPPHNIMLLRMRVRDSVTTWCALKSLDPPLIGIAAGSQCPEFLPLQNHLLGIWHELALFISYLGLW